MKNVYRITADLFLVDGTKINITDYIREVVFLQSIKTRYIIVDLKVSTNILKFIHSDFSHIDLNVGWRLYENMDFTWYHFRLVPRNVTVDSFIEKKDPQAPMQNFQWIPLVDKATYDICNQEVKSDVYEFKTIKEVLHAIYPGKLITDPTMQSEVIEQVYIPTMTQDSAFNYLEYWFGYYQTATDIAYIYDPEYSTIEVRIIDVNYRMKNRLIDFNIRKLTYDNTVLEFPPELERRDLYVTHYPVQIKNHLARVLEFSEVVFIEKPLNYLYKTYQWENIDFINSFSYLDTSVDPLEDNVTLEPYSRILIRNHTGFKDYPITSVLGTDLGHSVEVTTDIEYARPFAIWPSYIVKIEFTNMNMMKFSGVYHTDVVKYHFKMGDPNWHSVFTFKFDRANYITR